MKKTQECIRKESNKELTWGRQIHVWELYKNATEKIQGTYPHMAEILILQTSEKRRNNSAEYQSMQFQLILKKKRK